MNLHAGQSEGRLHGMAQVAQMQPDPVEAIPPLALKGVNHVESPANGKM